MAKDIVKDLSDIKHRRFPRPFQRLALPAITPPPPEGLVGVEIGVAGGLHAKSLAETPGLSHLFLVDPYKVDADDLEGASHWGLRAPSLEQLKSDAHARLAPFTKLVTFVELTSTEAARSPVIPTELDFVYIDGNHSYRAVCEDIRTWWPKIRAGGALGGHDFYNGYARSHDGVVRAVTEFTVRNDLELQVELPDWWIRKTLTDSRE